MVSVYQFYRIIIIYTCQVTIAEPQQQQKLVDNDGLLAGASAEDRLRAAVKYKNIRIREFFRDFDPLRKGVITGCKLIMH